MILFIGAFIAVLIGMNICPKTSYVNYRHKIRLEQYWTAIPLIIVGKLIVGTVNLIFREDLLFLVPIKFRFLLKITRAQWYWNYQYIFSYLHLPFFLKCQIIVDVYMVNLYNLLYGMYRKMAVSMPVFFCTIARMLYFTTFDVIHRFSVPSLSMKIDCIPGRINIANIGRLPCLTSWFGRCTEICGVNHSFMPIQVSTPPEFDLF